MKISKSSLIRAAILAVCGFLLVGCGSDGASTTTSTTQVTAADSPIHNTTGVKTSLDDGTQVYLLSENTNTDETKNMKIVSNPNKTGGDTSELVGKTFLEFENVSKNSIVAIPAVNVLTISECDLETKECRIIPYEQNSGYIKYEPKSGKFYAMEK